MTKKMKSEGVDHRHPADYIVFFRQSDAKRCRNECDWVLENTETTEIVAHGSLEEMMELSKTYPNSRRATWAEDTLRYKSGIFYQDYFMESVFSSIDDKIKYADGWDGSIREAEAKDNWDYFTKLNAEPKDDGD